MRKRGAWVLVAALAGACGGDSKPMAVAAGSGGADTPAEVDSGAPDSGRDAGKASEAESGGAGSDAVSGGAGSVAEFGGSGGDGHAYANAGAGAAAPSGGQGGTAEAGKSAQPMAGQQAPSERVLWSQSWSVAIHESSAAGGYQNATMGMALDGGDSLCRFGFMGASSGSTQEFATDGACITEGVRAGGAVGLAAIFDSNGLNAHGSGGRTLLSGWTEAVTGHTVTKLRRTQTYTIQLLGSGDTSYNYADFNGTWEAIGR